MVLYIVSLSKRKSTNSLFMLVDVEKHEVVFIEKDEFSFSVETVLPSHGFPPMGVYHVGLFDGLLPFVNVACGAREVKPSCDFLEKYQV